MVLATSKRSFQVLLEEERRDGIVNPIARRVNKDFELFIQGRKPEAVAALLKDEQVQVQSVALSSEWDLKMLPVYCDLWTIIDKLKSPFVCQS